MNEIAFLFNANIYFYPFLRLFEVEFCLFFQSLCSCAQILRLFLFSSLFR